MATEWFYYKGDERVGPVSAQQLKSLVSTGKLLSTDLVWKEGMAKPVAASKLKGLFGDTPPKAQAVPVARAVPVETTSDDVADDSHVEEVEASSPSWIYKHRLWLIGGLSAGIFLAFAFCCGVQLVFGLFGKNDGQSSGPDSDSGIASGKKYTDYLSAEELNAMKHPIKAESISEAYKESNKKGVEFIRWTNTGDTGSFMVDGKTSKKTKDVKFYDSGDAILHIIDYHPNGKKKLWVYFSKKTGAMTSETEYDTDEWEKRGVSFGKYREEFSRVGNVKKSVWYYQNGNKATEFYGNDPREDHRRNSYWDEAGNKITQDAWCGAEYSEDWRRDRSKQNDANMKQNIKELEENYKKLSK